jgi:general transcription factor 3C polypeptide 5 (transcription factor C subunit 1)
MCVPILSHNAPASNVLVKITVPKRIGKRKRGSQEPYQRGDPETSNSDTSSAQLLRVLKDNQNQYKVEAVAEIERTHRYRGMKLEPIFRSS